MTNKEIVQNWLTIGFFNVAKDVTCSYSRETLAILSGRLKRIEVADQSIVALPRLGEFATDIEIEIGIKTFLSDNLINLDSVKVWDTGENNSFYIRTSGNQWQMNRKNIHWGLSILVVVTLASFLWNTWKEPEEDKFKYGKAFNEVRDSLGVPKIEVNWINHESDPAFRFWAHPGRVINTIKPHHSSKTAKFEEETLVSENDDFHYETNDSVAYRVTYDYFYLENRWECKLIKYKTGTYPPTESRELTLEQADSVISKWGLSR
jgi:hypothetical protein